MSIKETLLEYIIKIFGKGSGRKHGDHRHCRRCWRRYRYVPEEKPKELVEVEKVIGYDQSRFCSEACATPAAWKEAAWGPTKDAAGNELKQHLPRQARRRQLQVAARLEINEQYPGEKRRQRRLVAHNLAGNKYRQERKAAVV